MRDVVRVIKTPITLVLLLTLVSIGGVWGWQNATAVIPPRPPDPCVMTDVKGRVEPRHVTVRILNGGSRGGLGRMVGVEMRSHMFKVIKINNTERRLKKITIVGNAKDSPEVKLVAGFFKGAVTEGDGRPDHFVDVLIADPWQGYVKDPQLAVPVTGPVCLPIPFDASISPTPAPTPSR